MAVHSTPRCMLKNSFFEHDYIQANSNITKKAEKLTNFFLFLMRVYLLEKYEYSGDQGLSWAIF